MRENTFDLGFLHRCGEHGFAVKFGQIVRNATRFKACGLDTDQCLDHFWMKSERKQANQCAPGYFKPGLAAFFGEEMIKIIQVNF